MAPDILVETRTTLLSPHRSPERYKITDFYLPVLVYRACLPSKPTVPSVSSFLEPNRWIQGNIHAANLNDPPHQCLAVLKGHNRLLLGRGPFQPVIDSGEVTGGKIVLTVDLYERDVLVLPAGVLRHSVLNQGNYEDVVFFPKGSPQFLEVDIEKGRATQSSQSLLPDRDPIFGIDGPLVGIWKEAEEAWLKMASL